LDVLPTENAGLLSFGRGNVALPSMRTAMDKVGQSVASYYIHNKPINKLT